MRPDFSRFDSEDTMGWIYQAEQFFRFNQIEDSKKILLASYHIEKETLQWFQWYEMSQGMRNWRKFVEALCTRFGPSLYEDYMGQLTKLC